MIGLLVVISMVAILIIIWIIASFPVYLAAKALTGGKARFGQAMGATLLGPLVYGLVSVFATFFLGIFGIVQAGVISFILAFLALLGVYKSSFNTGGIQALGIAILATIIIAIIWAFISASGIFGMNLF